MPGKGKPAQTTYADAGVNIKAGVRAVDMIKDRVRSTFRSEVVGDIGGFGGIFAFDQARFKEPLLVSSTDGVGTKLVIAQRMGIHDTVGIDLVAMCVDDIAAHGAEPLFFQDYIAIGKVNESVIADIVDGVARGCKESGCALTGGEIAEHPGVMEPDVYDLAGFSVGVVERTKLITGQEIAAGDVIIGLESSGLHSNGFSLVRKVLLADMGLRLEDRPMELGGTLGEELLKPTTIYAPALLSLHDEITIKGAAHITGGGIPENLGRILPEGLEATIDKSTWEVPPIFELVASLGGVMLEEMYSTFNMGIGMVVVVADKDANRALDFIRSRGHRAHEVGVVSPAGREGLRVRIR